jgi:hypothetical protein
MPPAQPGGPAQPEGDPVNVTNVVLRLLSPKIVVRAHCDLPCGVYDPEQARIEA